jgi:hypothetical protein
MSPIAMKASTCMPLGTLDGTAKVTLLQLTPPSWVTSTIAEPPFDPLCPKVCGMSAEPATKQSSSLGQAMSDRDGCGAFVGNASGTHVKPPSLEAAMSLTVVVL